MVNHPNRGAKKRRSQVIKTNGPIAPKACPFPPQASIVLDPFALKHFGGLAALDAWCAKVDGYRPARLWGETPRCYREGDSLYLRSRDLVQDLLSWNPLLRQPIGDVAFWNDPNRDYARRHAQLQARRLEINAKMLADAQAHRPGYAVPNPAPPNPKKTV